MNARFKKIFDEFSRIDNWDSWYEFESRYFDELTDPPMKEKEEIDREAQRRPVNINGILWKPVTRALLVDEDLAFFHWKLQDQIFSKLEPEAAAENAACRERFARWCLYCGIRTNDMVPLKCPICERELLNFPLNDKS